ncbi:UNVERIFIED_CONTAM: hypothetical protein H355_002747, partial [Colinus virginianus]
VLEYNGPGGKWNRGMTVVAAYRELAGPGQRDPESLRCALAVGWCIELFQAFFLVADDIMDQSLTRRGQPCWYKKEGIGLDAINDAFLLESSVYRMLKKYCGQRPYYVQLLELFLQTAYQTELGQMLDLITAPVSKVDLSRFSEERYKAIVKYKTAFYSFYLPVAAAMYMVGIDSREEHENAKAILLEMGEFFQIQDDYLDCFGDPALTGKVGTDIQDNKCSWLVVQCLQRITPAQRRVLEHISLGLHLSRHPELRDSAGSQKCCGSCRESCEQVDANSNNPSLKCHCCESHAEPGLRNRAAPQDFHCPRGGEEAASPCDPPSTSSSLSSCSDFSLDESPVSVYYRGFPAEPPRSPAEPPSAVPAEDGPQPNPAALRGAEDPPGESPDSLCSSGSLGSHYDETSPVRRSAETRIDLDPNCNPLPDPGPAPPAVPRRWERSGVPPPVPPRPKRRLQLLHGHGAARPAPPEPGAELCGDAAKRNITSFHELAQKRKRSGAAPVPSRVDRSDWLIVFSPDTELPPHAELLPCAASPDGAGRAPSCGQREITTFKELRYRSNKPKGQTAAPQRPPAPPGGSDGSGWASSAGSGGGRLPAAPEDHREQRGPRAALQPIADGRPRDAELPLQSRPGECCGGDTRSGRSGGSGGDPRLSLIHI